jgi:glycerol-3-phosphate dehydrogenase
MTHIGVIGAGAWGTALAQVAAQNGPVTLWAFEPEVAAAINEVRENSAYLPGIPLSPEIRATAHIADLAACDALLVVTPAQHMRVILKAAPVGRTPLLLCAKGIEAGTMALMTEVAAEAWMRRWPLSPGRPSRARWPQDCPPRSRSPARTKRWARNWRSGSLCPPSVPIARPT